MSGTVVPHIMNADGALTPYIDRIHRAIQLAEMKVFPLFDIHWNIDVIFSADFRSYLIPEDGTGGWVWSNSLIEIALDANHMPSVHIIAEMLAHELVHAARWGHNSQYSNSFIDNAIFEGLAVYAQAMFALDSEEKSFFITEMDKQIKNTERAQLLLEATRNLWDEDYRDINRKIGKDDNLPRWANYIIGYYLVSQYLEKNPVSITDAYAFDYKKFYV